MGVGPPGASGRSLRVSCRRAGDHPPYRLPCVLEALDVLELLGDLQVRLGFNLRAYHKDSNGARLELAQS